MTLNRLMWVSAICLMVAACGQNAPQRPGAPEGFAAFTPGGAGDGKTDWITRWYTLNKRWGHGRPVDVEGFNYLVPLFKFFADHPKPLAP